MARRAATLATPQGGDESNVPAAIQEGEGGRPKGEGGRRKDEITLRVPNPLTTSQKAPPAPEEAPTPDPGSLHSAPTAKLKVSSLVWNEYNSMPLTPPPVAAGQAQNLASSPGSQAPAKNRRALMFVLVVLIIGAGVTAGVLIPREKIASRSEAPTESMPSDPVSGTAEKSLEAAKSPGTPAAKLPAPSAPSKRHVSVTVEPATATLILDGVVAGSSAIARDYVQDKASHVVQASAPGYQPFKKSFTLQEDVNLRISLKKAVVSVGHPKTRSAEPAVRAPEGETKNLKPRVEPVEDFGMDLNRPAVTRQTKKMDEKDPYAP